MSWSLEENNPDIDPITVEELKEALKSIRNRKSPGTDEINNELLKYANQTFFG